MKAIRIHNYGLSDELRFENVPDPEIKDNQVAVKVYATSINHLDLLKASGKMKDNMPLELPWIPGHDFAGIIVNPGFHENKFKEGDAVYGNCNGGSFAEYLAVDIDKVAKKPDNLTFVEAASVPHVAETAWQAVFEHGRLRKGQKVLIHGAAGAVGAYAVQFAKKIGAQIYATASTADKEYLYSLGAFEVIDYKAEDFTKKVEDDMDLVLVLVGGDTQHRSYSVLKEGGRLVSTTGPILESEAKKHKVTGIAMVIRQSAEDLKEISDMLIACEIKTDVAITYPLEEAATGWKLLGGEDPALPGITHGKVVLEVVKEFVTPPIE